MQENISKAKKVFSRFGLSYTLLNFFFLALMLIATVVYRSVNGGKELEGTDSILVEFALRFVVLYPLMYVAVRNVPKFEIPKKKMGVAGILGSIVIAYSLLVIFNIIGMNINSGITQLIGSKANLNPIANVMTSMPPILELVIVPIIVPIFEELLFRKFLIDRTVNYGEVTAMLISGFMFGLYHGNFAQFVYTTVIGMFLAFIYMRTGKVIYTIIIHAGFNLIGSAVALASAKLIDTQEMMGYLNSGDTEGYQQFITDHAAELAALGLVYIAIAVIVILGVILMIVNKKKFVFENHPEEIQKGKRFNASVVNVGMIMFILVFGATIILGLCGINWYEQLAAALIG